MKTSCYFCELVLKHIPHRIFQYTRKYLNLLLNMTDTLESFGLRKGIQEAKPDLIPKKKKKTTTENINLQ